MARFIVKQPNGKYCIFGTIVDDVLFYNLTKEELKDVVVDMMLHKIEQRIEEELLSPLMSFDEVRKSCRSHTENELSLHKEIFKEMGDKDFDTLKITDGLL
jgi:hypothetical protein